MLLPSINLFLDIVCISSGLPDSVCFVKTRKQFLEIDDCRNAMLLTAQNEISRKNDNSSPHLQRIVLNLSSFSLKL